MTENDKTLALIILAFSVCSFLSAFAGGFAAYYFIAGK